MIRAKIIGATGYGGLGIMSTLYGDLDSGVTRDKLLDAYRDFYHDEPFVKVYDRPAHYP
ncbi:MAG: hypothetical protein O2923_13705 [Verrucomicrobia bacterium]|nr:hypothetical protein [Verrucomicrobiota bacterium]MDA1086436.1 hypothetical protein [Verrucomicrobiota bacterium]